MTQPIALRLGGTGGAGSSGARAQVTKAKLRIYECQITATGGKLGTPLGSIDFQFNPKEVSLTKGAKWERRGNKKSRGGGPPEFTASDPCKLTLEMFLDASTTHDGKVVETVERLLSCLTPTDASRGRQNERAPLVVLEWGAIAAFPAFITQISVKYTVFAPDGTPLRATCSLSLEEMPGETDRQNPTSGSTFARNRHVLVAGETLATLAYREYGDPNRWRDVAAHNGIDDPLRVRPGTVVVFPTPEDLAVRR